MLTVGPPGVGLAGCSRQRRAPPKSVWEKALLSCESLNNPSICLGFQGLWKLYCRCLRV